MYQINNELLAHMHCEELLREAVQIRQAAQARGTQRQVFYWRVVYLIGSHMIQWGQRLEHLGTSRIANPLPPASVVNKS